MQTSGVADLAGRVLAGRYRLVAPIGTGASGRVYAAWDVRLRRRVAVKVLHAALADDAGFLRRFGTEAQVAASLHHPHVVAVYDWGEDETPFMVLELLEGGSLRAILDRGKCLSLAQAAAVGQQVAAALDYAHARGVVHRDVKPANLLFDEHGSVRVADFGLARALAEASWTEPAGAVLGTARYAAPEQVRGVVDARSDLYSLALVLVEAVTGTVPFAGETSLTTLFARVEHALEVPAELGPIRPVLERAGRVDPAERFPDAASFGAALAEAAAGLLAPGPLPLAGPISADHDPHPTEIRAPAAIPVPDAPASPPTSPPATPPSSPPRAPGAAPAPRSAVAARASRRPGGPRRRVLPLVVLLLVMVAAGIGTSAYGRAAGPRIRVPNLVGRAQSAARRIADEARLSTRIRKQTADDPAGTVIGQVPEPGTLVAGRHAVRLVVSSGPPPVALPDVTGRPEAEARAALEAAGFVVSVERRNDEEVAAGRVVAEQPGGGTAVAPGSEAHLVVSDGPRPVIVPNVVGRTYEDAARILSTRRLEVKKTEAFSDSVPAGEVIRHDPVSGEEVPRDSVVTLVVSKGEDLVDVPDVRGSTVEMAVAILEQAGLEVDVSGYRPFRLVKQQDPKGGRRVHRGETVTLYL